jgi:hypothetical protein
MSNDDTIDEAFRQLYNFFSWRPETSFDNFTATSSVAKRQMGAPAIDLVIAPAVTVKGRPANK